MPRVIFLKGLPGSSKSTWARQQIAKHPNSFKRVNKDDLRAMVDDGHWSLDTEKLVLKMQDALILAALEHGKNVIVDNTHLVPAHEARIRQLVKGKAEFEIKDFLDVPLEECIKRDLKRSNSVGEKVIRKMWEDHVAGPIPEIKYNVKLTDCVICDLDGTLCLLNGRDPYDASTCEKDILNEAVQKVLNGLQTMYGHGGRPLSVIFFSGREDKYRPQTEKFLGNHHISSKNLYMRRTNDSRPDDEIKLELYRDNIEDKYNVIAVIDDRLKVCRMWHRLGLPLFRVGNPDADF
jgi:predicted kinase